MTDVTEQRQRRRDRRRNQNSSPTRRESTPVTLPPNLCVSRSIESVGTIKCSCKNAPPVYLCDHPSILSGFATPTVPSKSGDGPILFKNGSSTGERFMPYPLRDGEIPRKSEVICCDSCPHRIEPPPQVVELMKLGVNGGRPDGTFDLLHVLEPRWDYKGRMWTSAIPDPVVGAFTTNLGYESTVSAIQLGKPKIVVFHALIMAVDSVREMAKQFPDVKFISLFHGSMQNLMFRPSWANDQLAFLNLAQACENCFYATPDARMPLDTLEWRNCVVWPNLVRYTRHEGSPVVLDPPRILISGRFDIVKGIPGAILAAGLVNQQIPIELHTIVEDRGGVMSSLAATAKLELVNHKFMDWPQFHTFLRDSVSLLLHPSLTDAHPFAAIDALCMGRPVVGSEAVDFLPASWKADANDPATIAKTALSILRDYPIACEAAQVFADDLQERETEAFLALYERLANGPQ